MHTRTVPPRNRILPEDRDKHPRGSVRGLFALIALLALATCDGGPGSGPEPPAPLTIRSGDGQTADARTAVPNPPTVQVTGESGAGVGGVTVSFTVTGGGGSVASATAVTGSNGVASSGPWTLGDPGPQQLRASVSGLDPVVFTATARDVPATLVVHAGDGQRAVAGTAVPDPIQVHGPAGAGGLGGGRSRPVARHARAWCRVRRTEWPPRLPESPAAVPPGCRRRLCGILARRRLPGPARCRPPSAPR